MGTMETAAASIGDPSPRNSWQTALTWVLRITIFVQAVGNWRWLTQFDDTPLFELLWLPIDAGGLGWLEADALRAQRIVGWVVLACGTLSLVRPGLLFTGPLLCVQVAITVAMCRSDIGYPLTGIWPPPEVKRMFPIMTQSLRMAAPLALIILDPWWSRAGRRWRLGVSGALLRLATAATFCAHAIEAGQHSGQFVDMLIEFAGMFGLDLTERGAEQLLTAIALQDFGLAGLCLVCRSRVIIGWAAAWGLLTALSRLFVDGIGNGLHETLTRLPHAGGPLALLLIWHFLSREKTSRAVGDREGPGNMEASES